MKSCICEVDSFRVIIMGVVECIACPIGSSTEGRGLQRLLLLLVVDTPTIYDSLGSNASI